MQRFTLRASLLLTVAALMVAFVAPPAQAEGETVTFVNQTDSTRYVLATWGDAKSCDDNTESANFVLEAGEETEIDTGGQRACYCVGRIAKVGSCQAWEVATTRKTERIRK